MESALERTTRAHLGIKGIVMAKITFCVPVPKIETTESAMMMSGKEMKISMKRWNMRSKRPPKYALPTPRMRPAEEPIMEAENPMNSAVLAPKTMRVKISRPN